jgi:cytochrome P450
MLLRARRDMLGFLSGLAREHGDVARVLMGSVELFLLSDPELIRNVLVRDHANFVKSRALEMSKLVLGEGLLTSEDPLHKRQRRLMQPAFHRQAIQSYAQAMTSYAQRWHSRWEELGARGSAVEVDMHEEMMGLTLAIVGRTLFNAEVEAESREIGRAMDDIMPLFNRTMLPWAELLNRLPLPSTRRLFSGKARLDEIVTRIIHEHSQKGEGQGDLVSMLLAAQEEDGSGMSEAQVRDEALTIFLAGHETTANALTYTWRLLAQNPEAEARLHEEVDRVLTGRFPTVDDLPNLPYTEMVFAESMRLYPPAWALGRRALNDYEAGGYPVPANSVVVMSQWIMHRDPRFFPEPERFDPERWRPEAKEARPKFSYFPFGSGPRVCIGESFAWMEGVLLIAALAQRWRMRLVPGQPFALEPLITLRPKYPVRMTLHARA